MLPVDALFVVGSWLFWGTYPVPFKSPSAVKANTDPFVFQCMKSLCACLTSWIILTWRDFTFTYWGFVGAALWVPSGLLFITSVKLTGVAFATPIANGCQVIVSFCWGAFYFKEPVHSALLSVVAMLMMIVGMVGISFSTNYEKMKKGKQTQTEEILKPRKSQIISINVSSTPTEESPLIKDNQGFIDNPNYVQNPPAKQLTKAEQKRNVILGIILAMGVGLFGGSQSVPLKHAPASAHGILYVISFGIGAVAVSTVLTVIYICIRLVLRKGLPIVNLRLSFIPGTMAGILWSLGNMCQIYATLAMGATIGFPLVMCNMMVAGLWGVFYYNEAPSIRMKIVFILSCGTLLGGVTILSLYG